METFLNGKVIVKVGDLTEEVVDAIVNAANSTLLGGGGVDGAIHDRGGPQILSECEVIRKTLYPNGLPTGQAVITSGGWLTAKHVIHTVGPIYGENNGRDAELLGESYLNSISLARANGVKSVAFPSISTGAFGYPKDEAAKVASAAIRSALTSANSVKEVRLIFFSTVDAQIFLNNGSF